MTPRNPQPWQPALAVAAALGALAGLAIARPARAADTGPIQRQLERGEVVCLTKFRKPLYTFDVFGYIEATPDEVWRAITLYDHYQDFLPLVTDSAVRKRAPATVYQYVKMAPPWPFHQQWMINANQEDRAHGTIAFHEAEGNVKVEYGYWQVTPAGACRTRLLYHLTADPWMDYIPPFVVNRVTQVFLPNVIKGVRKRIREDRQAHP